MYIAIISLVTNIVISVVSWGGTFNSFSPPADTYAVEIPVGVTVNVGDSYDTGTQTFTANNATQPTPTPIPPQTIGDCVGSECFGSTNYLGGSYVRFWDGAGSGGFTSLTISPFIDTINKWNILQMPYFSDASVATLVAVRNLSVQNGPEIAQGDLIYARSATLFDRLGKNTTASRYLSNTGTNNNPAWAQIDLTNGVTGALPTANGGTGNTTGLAATATALAADPADCASNRYATAIAASGALTCGQVSLAAGVTGTLPVSNGGTGAAPGADDQVFVSSSTSAGTWASVPNCTDSSGNHLNYTASTNSFSCGTTSSASPTVGSDLDCDGTGAVNTTTATTVLTVPTFNNTGKTTVISGAVAINQSAAGAARTYTLDVRLAGTTKITFTGKSESATSKIVIPFHWVDSTCGSSCAYTVTITSDATTGTQTATDCAVSRVTY